jgi:hypothetical protein
MNIRLYNISAPPEKVVKITSSTTYTVVEDVVFFDNDSIDILNPVIKLKLENHITMSVLFFLQKYKNKMKNANNFNIKLLVHQGQMVILSHIHIYHTYI